MQDKIYKAVTYEKRVYAAVGANGVITKITPADSLCKVNDSVAVV